MVSTPPDPVAGPFPAVVDGRVDAVATIPVEAGKAVPPPPSPPAFWLYVSRRLDLQYLPNVPLWAAPVITFGKAGKVPTAFCRLTPRVFVWLEAAGASMEKVVVSGDGTIHRSQLDEYLRLMEPVREFARAFLDGGAVADARAEGKVRPPTLPSQAA